MDDVHAQQILAMKVHFYIKFYRRMQACTDLQLAGLAPLETGSRGRPEPRVVGAEMEVMTTVMLLFLSIEVLGELWYFLFIPKILFMS